MTRNLMAEMKFLEDKSKNLKCDGILKAKINSKETKHKIIML